MKNGSLETTKYIEDKISASLEPFLRQKNTEQTRRNIHSTLMNTMSQIVSALGDVTIDDIELDVSISEIDRSMMNITPKNFFTYLMLYGIYYPQAAEHPGITEYYAEKGPYIGTKFTWNPKKKEGILTPPEKIGPYA